MSLFNPVVERLEGGVRYEAQKASVVAHNVANMDTPGYQRVSFSKSLNEARKKLGIPEDKTDDYGDGSVNLENEMATLGKTKLRHSSYLKLIGLQYGILRKVVSQGKG
ncbi:MAG: flagellar basal body protein [Candidatus Margulisiibacteriota bacterium]|jgi:flagellar basal body rod protein FlgB